MQPGALVIVTPPSGEVVSLAEAKAYLRVDVDDTAQDSVIQGLLEAAREDIDGAAGWLARSLLTQTWAWTLPCFGRGRDWLTIPLPPLQAVTAVTYFDSTGAGPITMPSSDYEVDAKSRRGRIRPAYGLVWPPTIERFDAVSITFRGGYGDNADSIPARIKLGIKAAVATWYENREGVVVGTIASELPEASMKLLERFQVIDL